MLQPSRTSQHARRSKLPETNSLHPKIGHPSRKRWYSKHPFSGAFAVSFREGYIFSKTLPLAGECGGYLLQIFVMFSKPHRVWLLSRDGDLDRNFSPWDEGSHSFQTCFNTSSNKNHLSMTCKGNPPSRKRNLIYIYMYIYMYIYIHMPPPNGFFPPENHRLLGPSLEDHLTWLLRSDLFFAPPPKNPAKKPDRILGGLQKIWRNRTEGRAVHILRTRTLELLVRLVSRSTSEIRRRWGFQKLDKWWGKCSWYYLMLVVFLLYFNVFPMQFQCQH